MSLEVYHNKTPCSLDVTLKYLHDEFYVKDNFEINFHLNLSFQLLDKDIMIYSIECFLEVQHNKTDNITFLQT